MTVAWSSRPASSLKSPLRLHPSAVPDGPLSRPVELQGLHRVRPAPAPLTTHLLEPSSAGRVVCGALPTDSHGPGGHSCLQGKQSQPGPCPQALGRLCSGWGGCHTLTLIQVVCAPSLALPALIELGCSWQHSGDLAPHPP